MTIQIELWALITFLTGLLLAFFGGVAGIGKFILSQMDKRLDERFKAQEEARKTERETWTGQFSTLQEQLQSQETARTEGQQRWTERFEHIDQQLADYRERIGRLETQVNAAPTHDDLGELHEKINDVAESVGTLAGEFKGANHTLQLIHQFLLQGGKQS
ncbi:MAG TPA: hypothetical protein VJ576_02755 [Rhodocyclaceae bacterium]|nr:hypothetical protein [Rhodocyclaceae bacterium]